MWAAWGWGRHCNSLPPPTTVHSMLLLLAVFRYLVQLVATGLQRFLARFSGRRRPYCSFRHKSPPWTILALVVAFSSLFSIVEGCSSRTTPKPRPPAPTARPNVTFLTFECPPAYAAWYCLNGATCFTVKIGESLLYNCECSEGYMGPRCEYKDLDGSYLPSQRRILLETASIAGGATIAIILVFVLCLLVYVHYKRRTKEALQQQQQLSHTNITSLAMTHNTTTTTTTHSPSLDCVDGTLTQLNNHKRLPIFGKHYQQQQRRQQQQQHVVEQQQLQQQQRHLLSSSDINNHNYPPRNASCCGGGNNDYHLPRNNSCGVNNDCSNNDYLPRNGSHGNNDCGGGSSNNDYLPRNVVCCNSGGENNDSAELQQVKTVSDECGGEGEGDVTSERISPTSALSSGKH